MFEVFGSVLERLQGLFGKRFAVAGLGPVLILTMMSAVPALYVWPELRYLVDDIAAQSVGRQTVIAFAIAFAICLLGFMLFMANAAWRSVLERGPFGLFDHRVWRKPHRERRTQLLKQISEQRPAVVALRSAVKPDTGWKRRLRDVRRATAAGSGAGTAIDPRLVAAVTDLKARRDADGAIAYKELDPVFTLLMAELGRREADSELDAIHVAFLEIVAYAQQKHETAFGRAQAALARFPLDEARVTGTTLGNLTAANGDYFFIRYGMSVNVIWPLIETAAASDKTSTMIPDALSEARTRVDFTVAMNAVFLFFGVVGPLALSAANAGRGWRFGVASIGIVGAFVFYRLTIWNAEVFQQWVRSAVEFYRFDALKSLHIALPQSVTAERLTWSTVSRLAELGEGDIDFSHPAAP